MPTPKKRYKYTIFYTDGAFMTYELTKDDYDKIEKTLTMQVEGAFIRPVPQFIATSVGVIGLDHVRSVVEQKEEEPETVEQEPTQDTLPALDQESYNWLKQYMGGDR